MSDELEVISAFVDGERVDHDAFRRALADAAGRDYLIDLLALRESVAEMTPQMPIAVASRPSTLMRVLRFSGAAAALVLAIGGGYFAGHRSAESEIAMAPAVASPAS